MADRVFEELDEYQCLTLIPPTGVGRIAYLSRFGPAVLPINYTVHRGAVVFRTGEHGPLDEDLGTAVAGGEGSLALEIDEVSAGARDGWSVLIHGPARRLTPGEEEDTLRYTRVEPWAPGERELFIRIVPARITGRRVSPRSA
jgi:nitroimidazol reductase NimA-like FMN-containing flavoprotein (pyridoxamine 5'-phosphate oxidase superfamily)